MPKELEGQTQGFEDSTENDLKNQKQKNNKKKKTHLKSTQPQLRFLTQTTILSEKQKEHLKQNATLKM